MGFKKILKGFTIASISTGALIGAIKIANTLTFKTAKKNDEMYQKENYYSWEHGNIHYIKKGTGSPIILLHSLTVGSSHREFFKNIDDLSEKYTVYALDLPGYGYSDKPKITYTAFIYASFINKFITDVVGEPCNAIAANGSGMFLVIAAKLFPENIKNILLVSPSGINPQMAEDNDIFKRTINESPLVGESIYTVTASKKSIKKFFYSEGFFAPDAVDDEIIHNFHYPALGTNGDARYSYASFVTNYMNMDIVSYYSHITVPVYIVWGEYNEINPLRNMDILRNLRPENHYFVFKDTKLFPHIENYIEFNKIVTTNI